jgi:gamma-glutamylcyclotransferase (GGCT)/AIG2-like uncharacterized protein YtfP
MPSAAAKPKREYRLFVYGTLLAGQRNHDVLSRATALGAATTAAHYQLVELGSEAALVAGGSTAVSGELYLLDAATLGAADVRLQVPLLFQREGVTLSDGTEAEAHVMSADQVRGRRRIRTGDWRTPRGMPGELRPAGPFVSWARKRFR